MLRSYTAEDLKAVVDLWNASVHDNEVVYPEATAQYFEDKILNNDTYDGDFALVWEEDGEVVGYMLGVPHSSARSVPQEGRKPGYIVCFFVRRDKRGRGIGKKLLQEVEKRMREKGRTSLALSAGSPIQLDWIIPGTPGHDHNNAPGADMQSDGYGFLLEEGFTPVQTEVAMYLDLKDYREPEDIQEKIERLEAEGIAVGRYDPRLGYEFDQMSARVGSEYWRQVLMEETAKAQPRIILAATVPGHIVAFTGPVDKQPSGRGWFTGICTDPIYEKRGIGTVLFHLLMQEFILEGASFSSLFTTENNHARKVYERVGFRVARRFAVLYKVL